MGFEYTNLKVCSEIYPTNVSKEFHKKENLIAVISIVSASLSLIGSSSILGFIIWKKLLKVKSILPLFHLSLADFILAFFWIMTTAKYFVNKFENPVYTAVSCFVWQLLTEITHLATIFLTINYAVDVYLKMRNRTIQVHKIIEGNEMPESTIQKRCKTLLYIISWGLPIVIMMPIIANIRSDRISACQKCVIFIDVAVLMGSKVPWDYGYMVMAITLTVAVLILIIVYFLSLKLYWKAVPGFRTDHQRKQLSHMQIRVTIYILVFIVCWAPGLLISYHKWIWHSGSRAKGFLDINKYYVIYLLQAGFAPLQGFFNSIVYGWTKKTFRRSSIIPPQTARRNEDLVTPYYDFASSYSDDDECTTVNTNSRRTTEPPLGY